MKGSLRRSVLIMVWACLVVNSLDALASEPKQKKKNKPSLEEFVQQVLTEGNEYKPGVGRSKLLDIPPDSHAKALRIDAEESLDAQNRNFEVIFQESTPSAKSLCLVFLGDTADLARREGRNFYMRVSTTGVLEKMFFGVAKHDAEGNAIRGSGTHEFQDVNSPRIQKLFQYELEFWLEGKHRRKKPADEKNLKPEAEPKP